MVYLQRQRLRKRNLDKFELGVGSSIVGNISAPHKQGIFGLNEYAHLILGPTEHSQRA